MCMMSSAEKYYLNGCMGGGFYRSTLFPKVDMHNRGLLCTVNGLSDVYSDRGDAANQTFRWVRTLLGKSI